MVLHHHHIPITASHKLFYSLPVNISACKLSQYHTQCDVCFVPLDFALLVHTEELRRGSRQLQRAAEETGTITTGERTT